MYSHQYDNIDNFQVKWYLEILEKHKLCKDSKMKAKRHPISMRETEPGSYGGYK